MGLGPPVCTKCRLVMLFHASFPFWTCGKCGNNGHGSDDVSHLFCLDPKTAEEYKKNTEELRNGLERPPDSSQGVS